MAERMALRDAVRNDPLSYVVDRITYKLPEWAV